MNLKGDIREDYEFIKELGSGAYGIVYEASHKTTGYHPLSILYPDRREKSDKGHFEGKLGRSRSL